MAAPCHGSERNYSELLGLQVEQGDAVCYRHATISRVQRSFPLFGDRLCRTAATSHTSRQRVPLYLYLWVFRLVLGNTRRGRSFGNSRAHASGQSFWILLVSRSFLVLTVLVHSLWMSSAIYRAHLESLKTLGQLTTQRRSQQSNDRTESTK